MVVGVTINQAIVVSSNRISIGLNFFRHEDYSYWFPVSGLVYTNSLLLASG